MRILKKTQSMFGVLALSFNFMIPASLPALDFNADAFDEIREMGKRKIIVFKENTTAEEREKISALILAKRIKKLEGIVNADVALNLNPKELAALALNPKVARIEDDAIATISAVKSKAAIKASQIIPWGIDRIDAEKVWPAGNSANPVKVGIVDTGISSSHPDLKTNIKGGINTIRPWKSWNDDNGHGSHVAGIVAALNNTVGVVGAAPQADLYSIKVLSANGSGWFSDIIEGIDWAVANKMQVINMSLGSSSDVQSFHDAIKRAKNAGIVIVAAAGNDYGGKVNYPAAYPEVIAVSATDQANAFADYSSKGPEVDLSAPGSSIYSTYKGSGYATLSGTSMASPHVAGAALLVLNTAPSSYDIDGDGKWDPDEVKQKLQDTATDLGSSGYDSSFGSGLVNAYAATQ